MNTTTATIVADNTEEAKLQYLASQLAEGQRQEALAKSQAVYQSQAAYVFEAQLHYLAAQLAEGRRQAMYESYGQTQLAYSPATPVHAAQTAQPYPTPSASPFDSAYGSQCEDRLSPGSSNESQDSYPVWCYTDWYGQDSSSDYDSDESRRISPVQPFPSCMNAEPFIERPAKKGKQHPLMPHSNVDAQPFYPAVFLEEEERWNLHLQY
ncbi:unnamed protein product [Bursaphelenchus okinawaensis]|uniref:Uncharacterized protein n=1 Tax=Bursaphelenchus okinawaensis TaxID=465554 RepID=A0A811KES5_9BILA|nr:unnamed protein product [Bursaphelenchus okinawaensis]CAG9101888.1 unnamed protein product [Bursaphelenchus okinawaensis]